MRTAGIVVWRQIAQRLAGEIEAGLLPVGARLPPEAELAAKFGVNRHTLRQAVASLARAGLVSVRQGHGTVVTRPLVLDYYLQPRTRFGDIVAEQGRRPHARLLEAQVIAAPPEIAAALGCAEGDALEVIEVLREVDGVAVSLGTSHFPAARFAGIGDIFRETLSITAALRRLGVEDYTRRTTRVSARMPSAAEALLLDQPDDAPVLLIEAMNTDPERRPVEYAVVRAVVSRMQVVIDN